MADAQRLLRFIAATGYWITYSAIAVYTAVSVGAVGASLLDAAGAESRAQQVSLTSAISVLAGFYLLLVHLGTLAIGYQRWRVMSVFRWGLGSMLGGLLSFPTSAFVGRLVARNYPRDHHTLTFVLFAVVGVAVTFSVFELMRKASTYQHQD